ncbi:MAG: hypothetical protein ACYCQI_10390 [Gammaproteobacteria bacterium]
MFYEQQESNTEIFEIVLDFRDLKQTDDLEKEVIGDSTDIPTKTDEKIHSAYDLTIILPNKNSPVVAAAGKQLFAILTKAPIVLLKIDAGTEVINQNQFITTILSNLIKALAMNPVLFSLTITGIFTNPKLDKSLTKLLRALKTKNQTLCNFDIKLADSLLNSSVGESIQQKLAEIKQIFENRKKVFLNEFQLGNFETLLSNTRFSEPLIEMILEYFFAQAQTHEYLKNIPPR